MQDLDRSTWVQIFVILILFMILDGCGDYRRAQRSKLIAQQEFTRSLDSSGKRVVFRDQYAQRLGKWRVRKHRTRVYDASLIPQGDLVEHGDVIAAMHGGDLSNGDVLYEAHRLDGSIQQLIVLRSTPEHALYALGDAFEVERQQERWTLFHKEPYRRPVARITLSQDESDPVRVRELQTEFGTVERIISQDPATHVALVQSPGEEEKESKAPEMQWRGPQGISAAMMAPFVLKNVQWSTLEQSMFARLLDAAHHPPTTTEKPDNVQKNAAK